MEELECIKWKGECVDVYRVEGYRGGGGRGGGVKRIIRIGSVLY